jgi:hypothetical protein
VFLSRTMLLQISRIACANESQRLFTRSDFLWAKSILTGSWEEELKRIPLWIELNAGSLAGRIFQIAPAHWTHENGILLAEKLQWELLSSNSNSETTAHTRAQQCEFLGYLAKLLRSKSAHLNSKLELVAVSVLTDTNGAEEQSVMEIARARAKVFDNPQTRKIFELLDEKTKSGTQNTSPLTLANGLQLIANVLKESRALALKGTLMGGIVTQSVQ